MADPSRRQIHRCGRPGNCRTGGRAAEKDAAPHRRQFFVVGTTLLVPLRGDLRRSDLPEGN